MLLGEDVEGAGPQLRPDARWVAEPHGKLAGREQFFEKVIDRVVARRAREDCLAARHRLPDELDDGRRLAGPRRSVNDRDIFRRQRELNRGELGGVQGERGA